MIEACGYRFSSVAPTTTARIGPTGDDRDKAGAAAAVPGTQGKTATAQIAHLEQTVDLIRSATAE